MSPFLVLLQFQYQTGAFMYKPNNFEAANTSVNLVVTCVTICHLNKVLLVAG